MNQLSMFSAEEAIFRQFMPVVTNITADPIATNLWDIPYTIPQLSYLTHGHFRYYGKFPPVIAGLLIDKYGPKRSSDYIFDNFCGSGTTLVEAAVRGHNALGLDANWLAVLSSNVKVRHVSLAAVRNSFNIVLNDFSATAPHTEVSEDKWFAPKASVDLTALSNSVARLEPSPEKEFLILALLAIVRRVSRAFDGEVRPHVNKTKKQRDVLSAFAKKVREMIVKHGSYMAISSPIANLECILGDNRDLGLLPEVNIQLAISHPPYLNSFNYRPVFSLERRYAAQFAPNTAERLFKENELVAHPANESISAAYFNHLRTCYRALSERQDPGSFLAVVIGDCTVRHELIPVVDMTADILGSLGYELIEINYRTTHYGLGKYAYRHRADYHGESSKKDGILIFKRQ